MKLAGGIDLDASVDSRFQGGAVVATYSKLKPKQVLACWVKHLAACALGATTPSFLVGRDPGSKSDKVRVVSLTPVSAAEATALLDELVRWFWLGQRLALPFVPAPSAAYASSLLAGKSATEAIEAAEGKYEPEPGEWSFDPHAARAFDQRMPPFDADYERGEREAKATLFHEVALSVHRPLFQAGGKLG